MTSHSLSNLGNVACLDSPYLTVEEAAKLARSDKKCFYVWLSRSGSQGGKPRKRFPSDIYIRLGRKVLFIRSKFIEWLENGAQFEGDS